MRRLLPAYVISVVGDLVANSQTHASLDSLFMCAGAPGDPPAGSKVVKAQEWLRRTNKDQAVDPLEVLGRLIEGYMEVQPDRFHDQGYLEAGRQQITEVLYRAKLQYMEGGANTAAKRVLAAPVKSLREIISCRDIASINEEFDRALDNVEERPREAISAASNILESICRVYIEDENLEMPRKQDIQGLWNVVRKALGLDPSTLEDQDLQQILSGLISAFQGIGSLRTHASTAHGAGRAKYRPEPRHARLAVNAAHTVAAFVLECWDRQKQRRLVTGSSAI